MRDEGLSIGIATDIGKQPLNEGGGGTGPPTTERITTEPSVRGLTDGDIRVTT